MSKATLKQKEFFINKFSDFLSSNVGLFFTDMNGKLVDTQKVYKEWLLKEFNYKAK